MVIKSTYISGSHHFFILVHLGVVFTFATLGDFALLAALFIQGSVQLNKGLGIRRVVY